jgi:putative ABC transport system permease protein
MLKILRQCASVTWLNITSIPQRLWMSLGTIMAVAVAVGVALGFQALSAGFRATLEGSGSAEVALVLRGGSQSELNSVMTQSDAALLEAAPGVALDPQGRPLVSTESYVIIDGVRRSTQSKSNIPLRGMEEAGLALRSRAQIVEGRMFAPGAAELVVGRGLVREFEGFELGSVIRRGGAAWTVVGVFEAPGTVFEGEIWADNTAVQSLFNRGNSFQVARIGLVAPAEASLAALNAYIEAEERLAVEVETEKAYYQGQSEGTAQLVRFIGVPLGIIMAIGALAGALNTMFASVSNRAAEISTLRIIGFSGFAAFVGTLAESLALSLIGAVLGIIVVYFAFNGLTASTLGGGFTQVVFQLKVTPEVVTGGIITALVIGVVGGFFPGIRAATMKPLLGVNS